MFHAPIRPVLVSLALILALSLTSSCASTSASTGTASNDDPSEWLKPTAGMQRSINIKAMEVTVINSTDEYVALSDWFQTKGEQAYPKLLEMVESGDTRQRTFSLSVISAIRDRRLAMPLRNAMPEAALENKGHRYEYARALAMMGDFSALPVLIEGLNDTHSVARIESMKALQKATHNPIPYSPNASPEDRQKAVDAWMIWWERQQADVLLSR